MNLLTTTLMIFEIGSVISFDCIIDVPSIEFLTQENSYISFYQINDETSMEVQIFNSDKLNSNYSPLLFIHGYTDSRWSFLSTIQCMNIKDRAIIVPSLRGFGDSQIYSVESTFSIAEFTSDLSKLLQLLSVNKAVWIGHSMGSFIGHYAAGNAANNVDSIILLATGSTLASTLCSEIDEYINTTCPDRDFIDAFQEKDVIINDISVAYANQVVRESYKVDINPYQKAWYELCDFDSASSYLESITVNTTIIWGSNDGVTPFDQSFVDMFTATTPNVKIVKDVGHNVQWFAPDQVADIIKNHINYVEGNDDDTGGCIRCGCHTFNMFMIWIVCQIVYFVA
eukprot:281624_1